MAETRNTVVPSVAPIEEEKFHDAMMLGIARLVAKHGRSKVALALGLSVRQLGNIANGSLPAPHRLWNLLALDRTALAEVAALYGTDLRPRHANAANDMGTVADLSHLAGRWVECLADGSRDHRETLQLADAIRCLLPALSAIVAEADRIKAA